MGFVKQILIENKFDKIEADKILFKGKRKRKICKSILKAPQ
jgi:hypothetical protein